MYRKRKDGWCCGENGWCDWERWWNPKLTVLKIRILSCQEGRLHTVLPIDFVCINCNCLCFAVHCLF